MQPPYSDLVNLATVVVIATKGRPKELANLLDTLELQTVPPDMIVVSACDQSDIAPGRSNKKDVETIFGPPGLPIQRNRALSMVREKCDIVVFFDDDFIPSRYWIEHIRMLFASRPDVAGVTGRVLADGVRAGGLEWSDGQSIVEAIDSSSKRIASIDASRLQDYSSAYGCNMAFRTKSIAHAAFDERLVLYGWLEDRDFTFQVKAKGRMIRTDAVWGVHLGSKRSRTPGLKFGYAQVVNPWYLMRKGSMTAMDTCRHITRGLIANTLGLFLPNSHVDRWGRLRGNLIGIRDIASQRWAPERILDL
jgi:GT2 family glycosyltransferase